MWFAHVIGRVSTVRTLDAGEDGKTLLTSARRRNCFYLYRALSGRAMALALAVIDHRRRRHHLSTG